MSWDKLNVFQYQQLSPILKEEDEIAKISKAISILFGLTYNQIASLSVDQYIKYKKSLSFLKEEIKMKPAKYIKVGKRKYKCVYDIKKIPAARYIETKVFSNDFIDNIHKIAASMVIPMKFTIFGWVEEKYDASRHEEYANDMLEAKFKDVYNSIVFFYLVYRNWIECSMDYLIDQKMKQMNMSHSQATKEVQDLLNILDGNIVPNPLLTTTTSL
jgi:hypothetical protein